jgi:hypothetical protein
MTRQSLRDGSLRDIKSLPAIGLDGIETECAMEPRG